MSKATKTKPRTKTTKPAPKTKTKSPTVLNEERSARVIAEYLAIGEVTEGELDFLKPESPKRGLSDREIALTFRVSEVLGVRDAFEMAPRFRDSFAKVRTMFCATPAALAVQS